MENLFGARASTLGTWASHPIAVWFKKEINVCVRGTSVLSINDALMNETISATHEGKHTVYLFMQTGTGHFIFCGGVEKCAHLIQLERLKIWQRRRPKLPIQ